MNSRRTTRIAFSTLALASICGLSLGLGLSSTQAKAAPPANAAPQAKAGPIAAGGYSIDEVHSSVTFRIKHMNTSWAYGRFDQVSGTFNLLPNNMEKSVVNVSIDTASVDTGQKKRDDHLKSDAFLDVQQFPDATFASRSVKAAGPGKYSVEGTFQLHGVKKPLTVTLEEVGTSDSVKMGVRAGYLGTFSIQRSDFGIQFMPDALGDEVQITVSIEGRQTEATEGKSSKAK